jgi:predicted site-specific integrase-resolvase
MARSKEHQARRVEASSASATGDDLMDAWVAVITSRAVRLYGRRNATRRAAQSQACVTQGLEQADKAEEA